MAWAPEVFEAILARVAAGERARTICAEPGMPNGRYVHDHRKANPDFAQRWAAAQGRRKGSRVTRAEMERVLHRAARGEKLVAVCREPGMPSHGAVLKYRKEHPAFAARWDEEVGRRAAVRVEVAEIERVLERVGRGERLTAICAEPGMPSFNAILKHRRRNPDQAQRWGEAFGKRRGARVDRDPARGDALLAAAREGQQWPKLGQVMAWSSVQRLTSADSAFAARFAEARTAGAAIMVRRSSARTLSPTDLHGIVEAAVRSVHPLARDDVRGDLYLALLSGEVAPESARQAARGLVTAWNRQFGRRDVSFDQEIGEGGFTFGGLVMDPSSYVPDGVAVIRPGW